MWRIFNLIGQRLENHTFNLKKCVHSSGRLPAVWPSALTLCDLQVNIVSCDGKCPSASIYNYNINTYARFCKCCRETGLQRRSVQLYCSGNATWVSYSIQEPTDCSCQWSWTHSYTDSTMFWCLCWQGGETAALSAAVDMWRLCLSFIFIVLICA